MTTLPAMTSSRRRFPDGGRTAGLMQVEEAEQTIRAHVSPFGEETCALEEAVGRTLRADVRAERAGPPFDRVAMDGIAFRYEEWEAGRRVYRVLGTQAAGAVPHPVPQADACLEIMTGAALPQGLDTVVPVEQIRLEDGMAMVQPGVTVLRGQHVHQAGADYGEGEVLLPAGRRLAPADIAVAASAGRATLCVSVRPRIAVVSTGDELVDPGLPILGHQIRRSNPYGIVAALHARGFSHARIVRVRDAAADLTDALTDLLQQVDVLILTGGVSAGRFDHVPDVLTSLGVHPHVQGIYQKPGKPLWFGTAATGVPVFGLPGNPVSTLVCLYRYVLPALRFASGEAPTAPRVRVADPLPAFRREFTGFQAVNLVPEAPGTVRLAPGNGSGDDASLAGTDGFVEIRPEDAGAPAGALVPFYPWRMP